MKIGIASDHQGYERKQQILEYLRSKNYDIIDYGTDSKEIVDYTDYCIKLCENINKKTIDYGILVCGTGIGMSMCANKINGIYCAKVSNRTEATLCRKHNNANVIALSKRTSFWMTKRIISSFLHTPFLNEERYIRRINKLKDLEKQKSVNNVRKK